ncbi:GNAT family N-acetyltransferase [Telmatobacter sp. DSM 110680]|uniref:GNAT family N-acetyltransferase n=1 Tax=Telmatobacter sp. DSM 110680 TaxID=3036704 RepID=A0AAU7DJL3_9BACT
MLKATTLFYGSAMELVQTQSSNQVAAVREFNRFYTARLGLLRKRHLDGIFSLTEARMLYEIGAHPEITAAALCVTLDLDPGYISRLVALLTKRRLVRQSASKQDGRERLLTLSPMGERAVARLNELSDLQIQEILAHLTVEQRGTVVTALTKAHQILKAPKKNSVRIVRLTRACNEAFEILQEYYEAVHVVQRDKPQSLRKMIDAPASGMWLAYIEQEVVGCVILRKLSSIPKAGECKRMYVKPSARGRHIAGMLLDAQEDFAREAGLEWIYLDTYDDLKPAIAIYERRGYHRCDRYNDNPQATLFMRKNICD